MARRSSARLRDRNSSTPKRVSLSHDAPGRTPKTAPVKLGAVQESDEMPGAFPSSASPPSMFMTTLPAQDLQTPPKAAPVKPADEEMHPQHHQQTTAKPREEARHLGFSNIAPHTEPPKHTSRIATLQGTPTRSRDIGADMKSPSYHFTFRREHSLELSPEAKKLMNEKREEAAKIREQMIASGEASRMDGSLDRKLAVPKGKKGRFSQAHMDEFAKMDSIASHPSAFRVETHTKQVPTFPEEKTSSTKDAAVASAVKSLKRSPSKAGLDQGDRTPTRPAAPASTRPASAARNSQLPCSSSFKDLRAAATESSPAKRVRRTETDDVSAARPTPSNGECSKPSTPQQQSTPGRVSYPDLSKLTTPTQSSLARAARVKSAKTSKIPAPQFTPAKTTVGILKVSSNTAGDVNKVCAPSFTPVKMQFAPLPIPSAREPQQQPSTPLLARSPSKASLFAQPHVDKPSAMMGPLLARSPSKTGFAKKPTVTEDGEHVEKPTATLGPLLARSPSTAGLVKKATVTEDGEQATKQRPEPLLARSPIKAPALSKTSEVGKPEEKTSSIPFLARSPSKFSLFGKDASNDEVQIPGKEGANKLFNRFNLLRKSPMKSILRSPQRLYSDDPAKVAAGTHFATPPKHTSGPKDKAPPPIPMVAPATAPVFKRVDFSSSTKARDLDKEASSTPSKSPTPPLKFGRAAAMYAEPERIEYPDLATAAMSPSPQKRRKTAGPGDFTFRAGEGIIFGRSPNAPASTIHSKRPSTIRHISSDLAPAPPPPTGSKKRKFDFENLNATGAEELSDKENARSGEAGDDDEQRPAKRTKMQATEPSPVKAAPSKPTTLGVQPKKVAGKDGNKRPNTISQARLNALSQPKRRA